MWIISTETRVFCQSEYNGAILAFGDRPWVNGIKSLGLGSFFGGMIYERIVPREHFLVKLNKVADWEAFVAPLLPAYKGLAEEGTPPYSPVALLKMLVIAYLYNSPHSCVFVRALSITQR